MVDSKKLSELSQLAQQLNDRSDKLNTYIEQINKQLAGLNTGLECYIAIDTSSRKQGDKGEYEEVTYLGWGKCTDTWELLIKKVTIEYIWDQEEQMTREVEDERYKPLLQASRDVRLDSIEHLDELISNMTKETQRKLEALNKAERMAKSA